jgi:nucleotide-binding universal stress UspA family protein
MDIPRFKKILYATDLGHNMRPVFLHAIGMAKQYQAQIIMLHVAEPLGTVASWALETYLPNSSDLELSEEGGLKKVLAEMQQRLEAFYHEEMEDDPDRDHLVSDIIVASGNTAEEIQEHAEKLDADLIVIGTHTSSGMGHGFIGSAARRVIHIADRPVLVVPVLKK